MTTQPAPAFGKATLADCDRELIHAPGAIQAHGVLLVVSEPDLCIQQASDNLGDHFDTSANSLIGQGLSAALDAAAIAAITAALADDLVEPFYLPSLHTINGKRMDAAIHRMDAGLILELEPCEGKPDIDVARLFRRMLTAVHLAPSLLGACEETARGLRSITGFDRVMIYRFRDDGAGVVIAEDRRDELVAFLGLHYPASDIPQPARQLFVLNPIRIWNDINGRSASIVSVKHESLDKPLDMSRCVLRAASPIHLEYLRNMGVGASMALSIMKDGGLWGMIVCHHVTSRHVPQQQRVVLESLGHLLSLQIEAKEREERSAELSRLHDWTVQAAGHVGTDLFASLCAPEVRLLEFIPATGVAVRVGGRVFTMGLTPPDEMITALATMVAGEGASPIFATSVLQRRFQQLKGLEETGVCGLLALRISSQDDDFVMWFRPEIMQSVTWAGDPTKVMAPSPTGVRLAPRASFDAWVETVRDRSEAWSPAEQEAARFLGRTLSEILPRRREDNQVTGLAVQARNALLLNEFTQRLTDALSDAQLAVEKTNLLVTSLAHLADGLRQG